MTNDEALKSAVLEAAGRGEVREAVEGLYGRVQGEIEARRPVCVVSGRCCRFEEYGHRLFVTTMELGAFVGALGRSPGSTSGAPEWDGTGCPFQVNKLCSVHAIRPFGCRIFFCDATAELWQQEQYERFHGELKRLHEALGVPYYYVEWREGLRVVLNENTERPGGA